MLTASLPQPPRREALRLHVGRLWLEVRALGRTDPPLPEAHRTAPLPVPALPARFFALRPPGLAHEASSLSPAPTLGPSWGLGMEQEQIHAGWFSLGWTLSRIRSPTDPPKDQGLAHRQTCGSLQPKLPHVLSHREPHRDIQWSHKHNETTLQINGLSDTSDRETDPQRAGPSDQFTRRPGQWELGVVG